MEKLILTSNNFAQTKRQGKGSFSVFEKLEKIANFENVYIEAAIPALELFLHWEECYTPNMLNAAFMPLISPKLYGYKFQYLANFSLDGNTLSYGDETNSNACELFEAKMNNNLVFRSETQVADCCNCSWLVDFLLQAARIASDTLRSEKLIWQESAQGLEFVLESEQNDKKITERQIISFQNNFQSVSWQHRICIK